MNPYLAIALAGLTLKVWAGFRLQKHWQVSADRIWLLLFLIAAYSQSAIEITGYLFFLDKGMSALTIVMHAYYLTFVLIIVMFIFCISTVIRKIIHPALTVLTVVIIALFSYFLIDTHLIVEGYKRTQYAATRIPGEYYWIFQAMAITMIMLCISLLSQSYRQTKSELIRIKSANLLIGFIPFGVVITFILVGLRMGSTITAAGVLPFLVSIYIVVLAENLREDRLLDLRVYLPWTQKARLLRHLAGPLRQAGLDRDQVGELAEVYRRSLERQNHRVRLSKATEYVAEPLDALDSAAVKHAPRR